MKYFNTYFSSSWIKLERLIVYSFVLTIIFILPVKAKAELSDSLQFVGLQDISVFNDADVCGADIIIPTPTVIGASGPITITNSFNGMDNPSGFYPVGSTIVIFNAQDSLSGHSIQDTITVTVSDNEAPVVTFFGDLVFPTQVPLPLNYPAPVVSDNCAIDSVELIEGLPSGSVFPLGSTNIRFRVTDINGNETVKGFNIILLPTVRVADSIGYSESFETASSTWFSGGSNSSWELGMPNGTIINSASEGNNAWVTDLDGAYNDNENSFIISSFLNLTQLDSPTISFDVQYESQTFFDGASLQLSRDFGQNWETVGDFQDFYRFGQINFFDENGSIAFRNGWTGNVAEGTGSNGYFKAFLSLPSEYANFPAVLVRVLFTSGRVFAGTPNAFEGIAIDNIVLENFNIQDLNLTSICINRVNDQSEWRITNLNPFEVEVVWEHLATGEIDTLLAAPGLTNFFTPFTESNPNTTIIRWLDEEGQTQQNVKAANKVPCVEVEDLVLEAVCLDKEAELAEWKVINLNDFAVPAKYVDFKSFQKVEIIAQPGETSFTTTINKLDFNLVLLLWEDELGTFNSDLEVTNYASCQTEQVNLLNTVPTSSVGGIYPNPFVNELNVQINGVSENVSLQVFNGAGNMVNSTVLKAKQTDTVLNLSNLDKGIYFLKVTLPSGETKVTQIIKE